MRKHNYLRRLYDLIGEAPVSPGEVWIATVEHDDWCGYFAGGRCNCNPDVSRRRIVPSDEGDAHA